MTDKVIAFAQQICSVSDDPVLNALCSAAEKSLERRLKSGITYQQCSEEFDAAAGLIAAAAFIEAGSSAGVVGSFTVGNFSIQCGSYGDKADCARALRELAAEIMGAFAMDSSFCFMGVEA